MRASSPSARRGPTNLDPLSTMTTIASLLLLALPVLPQGIEDDGPHPVGWQDVTFPDPSGGGTLDARLYYPAVAAGQGTAADPSQGPFPLVALLHRYFGGASDYDQLSTHVASWGFFLASIDTQTGGTATMSQEAQDAADMLNWVAGESADPASPFAGMVAPGPWGALGHSMGGGALFYLIGDEPNVRVLVAMEPYRGAALGGFAGATADLQAFTGDLCLIGGDVDVTAPPATHSYAYFTTAVAAQRNLHTTVAGLGHQGPTDNPPTTEPLPADEQHAVHRRLATGFLRAELKGEEHLYLELLGEGASAEPFTQESRSLDPAHWAAPSGLAPATVVAGVAASPGDLTLVAASLAPAAIPTAFGILGLDLTAGAAVVVNTTLAAEGFVESALPVPAGLAGATLYFQGFALGANPGAFTAVQTLVAP